MLKHLRVRNIAIVEQVELDLDAGLTVITGESGSGKSILIDAISLAFGEKVSPKDVLRAGTERGQIELLFDAAELLNEEGFVQFLKDEGIESSDGETEILLSREFTASGSRSRINGVPVNRDVLTRLRPFVVDLHGQHELTSLFQPERQREYLDMLGDAAFQSLKEKVAAAYSDWQQLASRRERLLSNRQDLERQRDFLSYQLKELEAAQLTDGIEDQTLQGEREVLSHAEKLQRVSGAAQSLLTDGESERPAVIDQLDDITRQLAEGAPYDARLQTLLDQVEGARTELKAAAADLSAYRERVELNPERLSEITDRLDVLEKLKRKHGPTLGDVLTTFETLQAEWETLEADATDIDALDARIAEKEGVLKTASDQLTVSRQKLALGLEGELSGQLQALALPSVQFKVGIEPASYAAHGRDDITFLISANPGEPLKPLAKTASGGELSRFLLALKAILAQAGGVATLVFDEIDSGVSGPTAKAVAERLSALSRRLQVLVITHQPLIAALGRQHWHVEKHLSADSVRVEAIALTEDAARLPVLSRLVSGSESGDEAVERFVLKLMAEARAFDANPGHPVSI